MNVHPFQRHRLQTFFNGKEFPLKEDIKFVFLVHAMKKNTVNFQNIEMQGEKYSSFFCSSES
jgi:hypothetical protein